MNRITVGRGQQNNLVVGEEHAAVSAQHATIEMVSGQMYLEDHSTNGSYVNGQFVHNGRIAINPNDDVTLGREYRLDLGEVFRMLGGNVVSPVGRETERISEPVVQQPQQPIQVDPQPIAPQQPVFPPQGGVQQINIHIGVPPQQPQQPQQPQNPTPGREEPRNLDSFNWGAFLLNWIWSIGHGVYWGLLSLIPYVGIIPAIILGVKGNREAWTKFNGTAREFEEKEAEWTKWGVIVFVVTFVLSFFFGFIAALA